MKRYLGHMNIQPVRVNASTAAAGNSDWVNLANYDSCVFAVVLEDGAAADDVDYTVEQADTNAGGNRKVVAVRTFYRKQVASGLSADGDYSAVIGTTHQVVVEGENENVILVEVTADELDAEGGFKFVSMRNNGGGAATKTQTAVAILQGARYAVEPTDWPQVDA